MLETETTYKYIIPHPERNDLRLELNLYTEQDCINWKPVLEYIEKSLKDYDKVKNVRQQGFKCKLFNS